MGMGLTLYYPRILNHSIPSAAIKISPGSITNTIQPSPRQQRPAQPPHLQMAVPHRHGDGCTHPQTAAPHQKMNLVPSLTSLSCITFLLSNSSFPPIISLATTKNLPPLDEATVPRCQPHPPTKSSKGTFAPLTSQSKTHHLYRGDAKPIQPPSTQLPLQHSQPGGKMKGQRIKQACPILECQGSLHANLWNHIFQTHKSQN